MFDINGLPNTCGNCDKYDSCDNPYKDVNRICENAKRLWNEDKGDADNE